MSSLPENINFGNPNAYPTNFPQLDTFNQIPDNKSNKIEGDDNKLENKTSDTSHKITNFLNIKSTTILTFAIAIAIGFGIKDLLNAMVMNILQPSLVALILMLDKNDYLPITASLREKNLQIDISKFLGSLLVLKLIVGSTYLMYIYSNILNPLKVF
jgi:large-conductance mechanosensitive channel